MVFADRKLISYTRQWLKIDQRISMFIHHERRRKVSLGIFSILKPENQSLSIDSRSRRETENLLVRFEMGTSVVPNLYTLFHPRNDRLSLDTSHRNDAFIVVRRTKVIRITFSLSYLLSLSLSLTDLRWREIFHGTSRQNHSQFRHFGAAHHLDRTFVSCESECRSDTAMIMFTTKFWFFILTEMNTSIS